MIVNRVLFGVIILLLLLGCAEEKPPPQSAQTNPYVDPADPFAIPGALYALHPEGEDAAILHPSGFLASLSTLPENECDKEKLRRLVIAMNMYSLDRMHQTYYFETNTSGAKVIETTFPEVKKLYGEGGRVINTGALSDYLRGVEVDCPR